MALDFLPVALLFFLLPKELVIKKHFLLLLLINWLAGFGAITIGLWISCVIKSVRWALALVPVVMMPQILMGGLLRPPAQIEYGKEGFLQELWRDYWNKCSKITLQRWAFEAELIIDTRFRDSAHLHTADETTDSNDTPKVAILQIKELQDKKNNKKIKYEPQCDLSDFDEYFFKSEINNNSQNKNENIDRLMQPIKHLILQIVFLIIYTLIWLFVKLKGANKGWRWCT